ncbi:MAG: prolyl oligopeptidase family serine peptidase [Coprobacillaceae bacterium]
MKVKKILASVFTLTMLTMLITPTNVSAADEVTGNFEFDLQANVYDYGEAIDNVSFSIKPIDPTGLAGAEVDLSTIDNNTFEIKATATNPYTTLPVEAPQYGVYTDVERVIEGISVSTDGRTVSIDLQTTYNGAGQGTLNYVAGDVARNLSMDISYTVTQVEDFSLKNGTIIKADSTYTQGTIISSEVEKFSGATYNGINYQSFTPTNANDGEKHPLIIWFHGNGEGGYNAAQNNDSQLRANRGAIAFATDEAQQIFGGAYVIAPQAPDTWYYNYTNGYIETMTDLINTYASNNNVDTDRIYVYGCSAGGYMTTRMAIENPELFAAVVPTCAAVNVAPIRGGVETTAEEIETLVDNNIWFIHSLDDTTVVPETSSQWMHSLLPNSLYTEYASVVNEGVSYPGHWSWIYTALNLPINSDGDSIWKWTAKQTLFEEVIEPTPNPTPVTPTPTPNQTTGSTVVKTGDVTTTSLYSSLGMMALGTMIILINKKKRC